MFKILLKSFLIKILILIVFRFDKQSMDSVDINVLGRVFSTVQKGWALSGDVVESRCVPIQRRHFLRLHMSTKNTADIHFTDIQVTCSTKDVVFTFEQPMESDSRTYTIRFLVSRVGPFAFSISVKGQHISGSPFQVSCFFRKMQRCKNIYYNLILCRPNLNYRFLLYANFSFTPTTLMMA